MRIPVPGRKQLIFGAAAVVALGAGGAGIAVAQSRGDSRPTYTSSITVADTGGQDEGADAALAPLAKVSPDQAKEAALGAVPGTAGKVELENENGNVVYGVEVTTAGRERFDVKVDAGTGKVLAQEADNGKESQAENESGGNGAEHESKARGGEHESNAEADEPATPPTTR